LLGNNLKFFLPRSPLDKLSTALIINPVIGNPLLKKHKSGKGRTYNIIEKQLI